MYLSMIKYLVMGIKLFIEKKTCAKCGGGLLLPAWKLCQDCTPISRRTKPQISKVKPNLYSNLEYHCNKEKALESDMLVYDENMVVIGYRTPRFKLR